MLFIDPASISTGWAYYVGKQLKASGTISTDKKLDVVARLTNIWAEYRSTIVSGSIDEVHIEQLPRRCHHYTHWSVGVIAHALYPICRTIRADVAVKSWQKHSGWVTGKSGWKEAGFTSEDESAAVHIGKYWMEVKCAY